MTMGEQIDIVVDSPKKVVSFKLDVDIIAQIDETWPRLNYRSRSQFLREAVIFYLQYVQSRKLREEQPRKGRGREKESYDDIYEDLRELEEELEQVVGMASPA